MARCRTAGSRPCSPERKRQSTRWNPTYPSPQRRTGGQYLQLHARRCIRIHSKELSCACSARVTSLLLVQKRSNQEKTTPRLALAAHPWAASPRAGAGLFERASGNCSCVASTPASMPSPARAKRSRHPCRLPLRGLSTPTHRRTGAPGRAAGHPGPHLCAARARAN